MFSEPMDVDPFHLNQRSENSDYSCSLKVITGGLTMGVAAYVFGLRFGHCIPCLNNRILKSEYRFLMFRALKR